MISSAAFMSLGRDGDISESEEAAWEEPYKPDTQHHFQRGAQEKTGKLISFYPDYSQVFIRLWG